MAIRVVLFRRPVVILSTFFLILLALSSPLFAAGPAPAQNGTTSGPRIWLQANQPLPVQHVPIALGQGQGIPLDASALAGLGQSQPVSIAAGDLDVDGFDDLVVGYSTGSGGFISIHRGNIDAFAPQSDASFQAIGRGEFPSPFLLEAKTFSVPVSPDFVTIGNFIGNGNNDLAIAAKGGSILYIFPNDGRGNFGSPQTVNVAGVITALAAGTLGSSRAPVLIVGGARSLAVYVSTPQGLAALASYAVPGPVSNILFGEFGDPGPDVAFLSGGKIQILRSSTMQLAAVGLPVSVRAFAIGTFLWDRNHGEQIALVAPDGSVQIAVRNDFDPRAYTLQEFSAIRQARLTHQPVPSFVPQQSFPADGWKVVESFPGAAAMGNGQAPVMFRTRVSSSGADDVMVLNAFSGQLTLISHPDLQPGAQTFLPGQVSLRPYSGNPVTAIPMRINVDGRPGVLALHQGEITPSAIFPIPDPTFTVNTTNDTVDANPGDGICADNTGHCSLRAAIMEANAFAGTDTIMIPAGTYTLTIARAASPVYDAKTGTLDVTDSVNIIGAGQATTIIQGGTVGVTPGPPNGVDKVFSFNQDITAFTNATVNLSNVTIQNGFNRGNTIVTDGWGGAFDFDTGTNGTANLTVTDVTLDNNTLTDGEGGGFAIFNTNNSTGGATFSNCTVQNNIIQPNNVTVGALHFVGSANGGGGFVASPANMTMTNCAVKNNQANTANSHNPVGGGLEMLLSQAGSPAVKLHATTVSGNQAGGLGGGIFDTAPLTIDQGSMIIDNTAGKGGVASNLDGGGLWFNSANSSSITKSTFTGNQADASAGNGGGIFVNGTAGGALSISFSRFASNTAHAGKNLALKSGGTGVTAQDNWWGTNTAAGTLEDGAGSNPTSHCAPGAGQICFDPFIVLTHTASPNLIRIGDTSSLTADFLHDNHGSSITASNLDVFAGVPVTFNGADSVTAPLHGTISNAQPFIESQVNISTVSETGCASPPQIPPGCTATVTVTTSTAHGFSNGQTVTISKVTDPSYDGVFSIASTPTTTTFTYTTHNTATTSSTGGTASVPSGTATATYTATSGGIDTVNAFVDQGAAPATITVLFPPSIGKAFSVTHIPVFTFSPTTATLTFTITNPNTANALHGLAFTDNLPSGLAIADTTNTNTCGGTLSGDTPGSTSISYSGGTISFNAGGTFTCTVVVDVKGVTDGVQNNTSGNVTATDAGGLTGNFATASITVINPPSITKAFTLHSIPLNGSTTLTFTLSNSNANTTLNGVAFTDTLPTAPGTLVVSNPSNLNSTCSGTPAATAGSGTVSLSGATLAPGTSCTVTVSVTGTVAGAAANTVTPTSTDVGGLTGAASNDTVTIVAPPSIAKVFNPTQIALNTTSSLQFTITNPAPNAISLTGIGFTDTLPTGLTVASGTSTVCGGTLTTSNPTTISLAGATIAASGQCQFSVTVTGAAAGAYTNTTGHVTSNEGGTGNTASANLNVDGPPSIGKAFSPNSIPLNGTSTLTFTITNPAANPDAAAGVAFSDTLPTGLVVATPNGLTNSCGGTPSATAGGTSISLTGGSIAVNSSCTVVVNVTGGTAGAFTNTSGAVSSTNGGTGNTASDTLTVVAPPSIAKAFNPTTIALNGTTTLTFTIKNPAANTVGENGVAFSDTLPTGLVVSTPNGLTNSCNGTPSATAGGTSISLTGGSIAVNTSCTLVVNVTGTAAGSFSNTSGAVSSTNGGTGNTASANLSVDGPPSIGKAFSPNSIPLNGTSTLTFTITNPAANPDAAAGVAFSDTLPAGLVVATPNGLTNSCSGTASATAGGTSISLTGGSIAVNSFCTLVVNVTGGTAGAFTNTSGAVSSTNGGTGNTASDTLTVVAPPSIAKAFNPTTIAVNGTSTLTFTITNPAANTVAENGVAFSDTLPTGLVVATPNGLTNSCGGTASATAGGTSISLTGGTIAMNSSCTVVVNITGTVSGQYTNTSGAVSSTNGGTGNTATANLTVASPPSIAKAFNPKTIPLNGTSTLTFTIQNPNSGVTLTGVAFGDTLPTGLVVSTPNGLTNSCGGTASATAGGTSISLTGGSIAVSTSCTVVMNITGTAAGAFTNTSGAVSSTEGGTGNTATDTLTVVAPPSIAKAFSPNSIPLNGTSALIFTITNPAANTVTESGVAFSDTLPTGLVVATPNGLTNSCGGTASATAGGTSISLAGGSIAVNSSCTVVVNVTGGTAGAFTNTSGAVSSTNGGTGNTASDTLTVVAPPSIAKAFNPTAIALNGTTTLTFTIKNPAANTVGENGVAFSDTLPTGLVVSTPNGLTNSCSGTASATAGGTSISLTGGSIAVNSSCTVVVNVTGTASGQYTNTSGAVSSTNGGTGNTASANLTVASPPSITKSFNPTSIVLNATSTLSFSISNPNTGVALSGVAFTDSLPSGVQVAATPNVTGSCGSGTITAVAGSGTITLSGGTLTTSPAAGSTCNFSVDVTGTTAGGKSNNVQVTSTEGGTGNTSNASLTVTAASTTTGVASSSNPSVFGQSVTFTATVTNTSAGSTGAPTGSVQFVVDNVNFGSPVALTGASSTTSTANSAAIATLSVAGSPHTVSASYTNADGNFTNSSGSLAGGQTITLATTNTAVVSSANPSVFGQSVTFTATVVDVSAGSTAQPTGSVQFVVDGVNFGSPVTLTGASSNSSTATSQATATLSISGSPHSVTANYTNADGNFSNSTASLSGGQVVNQANTTTTVSPSAGTITLGDTVTFTATVTANPPGSGTPTGLVTFFNGSTPIGTGTLNGSAQATFSTALLPVGSDSITAIYNGDADFTASPLSSPTTETVNLRGSTTAVGLNPTTVSAGQASTITVTVTDAGASTPPGTPDVFSTTGAPATARTGFTSTLFADGLVLVAGGTGSDGTTILNSAEIYGVSGGTFSSTGNLNHARTGAVAVLLPNGKVLVAGGSSNGSANGGLNTAELFDPIAGTFAPSGHNMTAARFGATATVLNTGKVLLAGGANSGGVLNSAELYDPAADTFTATGNLNHARTGASATLLGSGHVLVAGGSSDGTVNGALNSAEVFDSDGNAGAGSFTTVAGANPTLATGRWQPEAALLLSGKVLIAGGQNNSNNIPTVLTSADVYDPVADSFTASTHQMNEARANGSAVALPNGMVLLPGGTTSQTIDLYDADNDKFNTTGSLLHHLSGSAATLLNNGQVLVTGINIDLDMNNVPVNLPDAELYAPSFNPLGTVGFGSSEATDAFGVPCVLTPSSSTASTCTSTVTPQKVATSPHTITGTYPADAVHSGSSNSASLTVIPTAPPTIAKAFSADKVAQNSTVNVSFTIVNPNSAATLTGISFTDSLPVGLVVATPNNLNNTCGGTVTAVSGSSSISLTGGTLAPPGPPPQARKTRPLIVPNIASGQCVISVDLLVTGTGVITNQTGTISANESGTGNPSNQATVQVVLPPTVNKNFGAASIPLNGTTSLTFNIANPNPTSVPPPGTVTPLNGITLNDTLPSGLVVATPNGLTGSCTTVSPAPVISATQGGNSISLSALNLPPAGSCSFSVNVKGTSGGTKNNTSGAITATFDDGSGTFRVITGGTASATIIVVAPPVISKVFVPPAIAPNGVSTLTFNITNPAANTVAEAGVAFADTLPANLVVATPNGLNGVCGGSVTATAGSNSITLTGGTVAVASTCVIQVNVTSSVPGSYTNTTGAVSSTNGGTGNTASATLTVAHASLAITKKHSGNFARGQSGATYTITVSDLATAGPTDGTTVTVTDTLPNVQNTLVPTAMSGTGWTCNLGTLTCTRSDVLTPGASYPAITLTVNVPQNIQANVTNSATVSGGGDPNSHTAQDPTHIGPPIQVVGAGGSLQVNPGGSTSMDFTVDSTAGEGTLNMACSGLPPGVSCSFNPPSTNQLDSTVTMTVTVAGNSSVLPLNKGTPPLYAAVFPVLGLIGIAFSRRKGKATRLRLALVFAGLMLALLLAGCGGNPHQVFSGNFAVNVTATSATTGDSGSTTVTITVL